MWSVQATLVRWAGIGSTAHIIHHTYMTHHMTAIRDAARSTQYTTP
jgi:hypothetical protein